MTQEQIEEFTDLISKFGKDGLVSIDDLEKTMIEYGYTPTEEEMEDIKIKMKEDDNSSIDYPEFLTLMAKKIMTPEVVEQLKAAFYVFDKDDDNMLTVKELTDVLKNIGEKVTPEELIKRMRYVGVDVSVENPLIDFDQFVSLVL